MERTVPIISLVASLITIGDMLFNIAFKDNYDYTTSISLILVVVALQLAFYYLLDLKVSNSEEYISIIYFALIPIIISVSGWGFYRTASIELEYPLDIGDIFSESFKAGLLIIITVGLFMFWSKATKTNIHKDNKYLSFAFGIPSVIIFVLATFRYTFSNYTLDAHFFGFIILLLITISLAAVVKSTFEKKAALIVESDIDEDSNDNETELSTRKTILAALAILAIAFAGIAEHWVIATIITVVSLVFIEPKLVSRMFDTIDKFR